MGKQRRRVAKKRMNPLQRKGVEAGISKANSELPVPTAEQVTPVVDRLSSENPSERAWAAACISNLILSNEATRKLLLSKGIVPMLIQRLSDPQQEVRDESLGALRNLASVDETIAKEYFSRNILESLSTMLPQISQTIDNVLKKAPIQDEQEQDRRKSIWDVTENYIYIIWCICEASDKYVKAINRMNIITFLTSFLINGDQCPMRIVIAAGQCLNTLSDDNKDLYIEFQNHPEYIQSFLSIIHNNENQHEEFILVQVLACAILLNIRDVVKLNSNWDDDTNHIEELYKLMLPILLKAANYDIQQAATNTISAVQSGNLTSLQADLNEITPKPKQPLTNEDTYVQNVENRLSIIQLSLELLSDICIQDEDDNDGIHDNPAEDDDDMMDDDGDVAENNNNNNNTDDDEIDPSIFSNDIVKLDESNIILFTFVQKVFPELIRLSTPTAISFTQMNLIPHITHGLVLTHQRSLECLNNFLLAMNDLPKKIWFKQYKSDAVQLWRWLFNLANQIASNQPEEWAKNSVLEVIIGCLWQLGRGLEQDIPLEPTDVNALCGTYDLIQLESMRVKIVGCLGPIAMRKSDIETNKTIGLFIMNILSNIEKKRFNANIIIEALNLIFDVYSDYNFDYDLPVFVQGRFLNNMKQTLPSIRSMVKSIDKRKDFDLRMRADEALDNLGAFIKYKKTEVKHHTTA